MMSKAKLDELQAAGAEVVGGICTLDGKEVGRWANGEFYAEPGMEEHVAQAKKKYEARKAHLAHNTAAPPHRTNDGTVTTSTTPAPTSALEDIQNEGAKSDARRAAEDILGRIDSPQRAPQRQPDPKK